MLINKNKELQDTIDYIGTTIKNIHKAL